MKNYLFLFLLIVVYVRLCQASDLPTSSQPHSFIQGVNITTGLIEDALPSSQYEQYQEGCNALMQESILLSKDDFRLGRVKKIICSLNEDTVHEIYLIYEPDMTYVYQDANWMALYRYKDSGCVQSIEYYHKDSINVFHLYRKECLVWEKISSIFRIVSRTLEDEQGHVILCYTFIYNEEGKLIKEILDSYLENFTSNKEDTTQDDGMKNDKVRFMFSEDKPSLLVAEINEKGSTYTYEYDSNQKEALNTSSLSQPSSVRQMWNHIVQALFSGFNYLQLSTHQTKIKWNAELQLSIPVDKALEKISKTLVGESTYFLMGPNFEETHVDCYGQREISDKVRLTFINGILNTREMMLESLDIISESHGGVKIHYVFRPTEGWTWDISRAIMIRIGFMFGFRSLHAHLLAQMWRELIQEMGGVDGGGVIVHYAHSLGGSETDRARDLLSPEEQKMIRVVTFGSATLIRNVGFQSVMNMVSVNDGVSSFILEPFGNIRNYFDPHTNVYFQDSTYGSRFLPIDHFLNGPTYGPILINLGEKFLLEFK